MKCIASAAAAVVCLAVVSTTALANSGPVYMPEGPAYGVAALAESDISVLGEQLVFDFSAAEPGQGWSPEGAVEAVYRMHNPGEATSILMAFPFVADLWNFDGQKLGVSADGEVLETQLYFGDAVSDENYLTEAQLDDLLAQVRTAPHRFTVGTWGALYGVEAPARDVEYTLYLTLEVPEGSRVASYGFNGYSYDGTSGKMVLSAFISPHRGNTLWFYVLGEDVQGYTIRANTTDQSHRDVETDGVQVTRAECGVSQMLERAVREAKQERETLGDVLQKPRSFNESAFYALQGYLDRALGGNGNHVNLNELMNSFFSADRIGILVYTVEFEEDSTCEVAVRCPIYGTMDQRSTREPVYHYTYLSNPAKGWSTFGRLQVTVRLPEWTPYVTQSNFGLTAQPDGSYTAARDGLPEENMTFTLSTVQTPSPKLPAAAGNTTDAGWPNWLLPVLIAGGVLIVAVLLAVVVVVVRATRKLYREG